MKNLDTRQAERIPIGAHHSISGACLLASPILTRLLPERQPADSTDDDRAKLAMKLATALEAQGVPMNCPGPRQLVDVVCQLPEDAKGAVKGMQRSGTIPAPALETGVSVNIGATV